MLAGFSDDVHLGATVSTVFTPAQQGVRVFGSDSEVFETAIQEG